MPSDKSQLLVEDKLVFRTSPQKWNTWIACLTTVQVIAVVTYYFYATVPWDPYSIALFGVSVGLLFCLVPMVFYTFIGTPFLASIMYLILLGMQLFFMAFVFGANFNWLRVNVWYYEQNCTGAIAKVKCHEILAEIIFRVTSLIAEELYGFVYIIVLWNAKHY